LFWKHFAKKIEEFPSNCSSISPAPAATTATLL